MKIKFDNNYDNYTPSFYARRSYREIYTYEKQIIQYVKENKAVAEIAQIIGFNTSAVYKFLKERNINTLRKSRMKEVSNSMERLDKEVPELLRKCLKIDKMFEILQVSKYELEKWLKSRCQGGLKNFRTQLRLDLFQKGMSVSEVSRLTGITQRQASVIRPKNPVDKENLRILILEKLKKGLTNNEVAAELNVSVSVVSKYKTKYKMNAEILESRKNLLLELSQQGLSDRAIAKKLEVIQPTIRRWIADLGIKQQMQKNRILFRDKVLEKRQAGMSLS